jgi:hypothetical protein
MAIITLFNQHLYIILEFIVGYGVHIGVAGIRHIDIPIIHLGMLDIIHAIIMHIDIIFIHIIQIIDVVIQGYITLIIG